MDKATHTLLLYGDVTKMKWNAKNNRIQFMAGNWSVTEYTRTELAAMGYSLKPFKPLQMENK